MHAINHANSCKEDVIIRVFKKKIVNFYKEIDIIYKYKPSVTPQKWPLNKALLQAILQSLLCLWKGSRLEETGNMREGLRGM